MQAPTSTPIIALTDCVGEVLAQAMVRRPELADRLQRAAMLVDMGIERHVWPNNPETGDYFVDSACEPGTVYSVSLQTGDCSCRDFQHRGGPCKHLLAVKLLRAASYLRNARQRAQDYGLPLSDPAADVARFVT